MEDDKGPIKISLLPVEISFYLADISVFALFYFDKTRGHSQPQSQRILWLFLYSDAVDLAGCFQLKNMVDEALDVTEETK